MYYFIVLSWYTNHQKIKGKEYIHVTINILPHSYLKCRNFSHSSNLKWAKYIIYPSICIEMKVNKIIIVLVSKIHTCHSFIFSKNFYAWFIVVTLRPGELCTLLCVLWNLFLFLCLTITLSFKRLHCFCRISF